MKTEKPIRDPQTHAIIGAAMAVHRELGAGFLEGVYQEALALEFGTQKIPFHKEISLQIHYRNTALSCVYRADFLCFNDVIVELKAAKSLSENDIAQTINYLKAARLKKAILINFGAPSLEYRRLVLNLRESAKSADRPFNSC